MSTPKPDPQSRIPRPDVMRQAREYAAQARQYAQQARQAAEPAARAGWARYRGLSTKAQVILAVAVLVLACGSCGALATAGGTSTNTSTTHLTAASTSGKASVSNASKTATSTPKTKPTATATAQPASAPDALSGAVLGASNVKFLAFYSLNFGASESRNYSGTINGRDAGIGVMLTSDDDSAPVRYINVTPPQGETWSQSTGYALMQTFLPSDAVYKGVVDTGSGPERLYTSASLATVFPADAFQNTGTGADVTPGTFYVQCPSPVTADSTPGCVMQLGE